MKYGSTSFSITNENKKFLRYQGFLHIYLYTINMYMNFTQSFESHNERLYRTSVGI
jgi:hypothetical protein